ncbi:MAG TPA: hypothetical protein VGV07_22175 [Devosia sp.]|jgi:hypothetical protein|uniref:hypothetical protein n=1 Tax=Devosia sp. TaxID=1871048 RepID=UPI002DDCBBFB|nr:hypothetical protein [Devosia sp.]HEV2517975.1 hypothetical protein [Devosia sp.]
MSGFVARLLAMATGSAPGAARLVLPPRFAGPLPGETAVIGPATAYQPLVAAAPLQPPSPPRSADARPSVEEPSEVAAPRRSMPAPREVADVSEPKASVKPTAPQPQPGERPVAREAAPVAAIPPQPQAAPASRPQPTAARLEAAARPATPPALAPAQVLPAPRRPLSEAAVAAVRSTVGPPVINVTIDRIEVRAATAPVAAPQRGPRQPPAPSVSLSDYLRGNGGGRR